MTSGDVVKGRCKTRLGLGSALVGVLLTGSPAASGSTDDHRSGDTELVSVQADGTPTEHNSSSFTAVSADGRYVAFLSDAKHLVAGVEGARGRWHAYLRDRLTDTTTAIDIRPDGQFGNKSALRFDGTPSISADGRFVAFVSESSDLVPSGNGKHSDIFVRDVQTGTTAIVSIAADGGGANQFSTAPEISADGTTVVFESYASNLLPDPPDEKQVHVYRRDLVTGTTSLVSRTPTGEYPNNESTVPSVSRDGMLVTFETYATDIATGGRNDDEDVILYDVATQKSTLISKPASGERPNGASTEPCISADGTSVVFESGASNLVSGDTNKARDIFRFTVPTGRLSLVAIAETDKRYASHNAVTDATGNYVAFTSDASDLTDGDDNEDYDVFLVGLSTGTTTLISRAPGGGPANGMSYSPALAGDGSVVAYSSDASNIVAGTHHQIQRVYAYQAV